MSQSSFIYVNDEESLSLEDVKGYFDYYKEIFSKAGEQLDWDYKNHAFPYSLEEKKDENGHYLQLTSTQSRYHAILVGVNAQEKYIQITLPNNATHGDKGKANEFAKFFAKKLNGKLKLFSGKVMPQN